MKGNPFKIRIIFSEFQAVRGILSVFSGDVPGDSGHVGVFLLGTLQDHLDAIAFAFLCHSLKGLQR